MKRILNLFASAVAGALLFTGCDTAFDDIKYSDGEANLTHYVAIGGGYTAGFSDSALYLQAQQNSLPAILAGRFALAGGGSFLQPLVNPGVGIGMNGNARYRFAYIPDACGTGPRLKAVPLDSVGDVSNYNWIGGTTQYNNMGVPGIRMKNLTEQSFGDPSPFIGNRFYARFATTPGLSTVTGDAVAQGPTFFTLWMGMEDIYGFARRGGVESGDSISEPGKLQADLQALINSLQAVGANGVIANLPFPNAMPFFTETDIRGLVLTQEQADTLNTLYAPINPAIQFQEGKNYYVINDVTAPGGRRQLAPGEFLLLTVPMDSIRCKNMGTLVPIPGRHVLDANEIDQVNSAIIAFNATIQTIAQQEQIAVVDMATFFNSMITGTSFGGTTYAASYPNGGFYSTDGFYPTPRGYALIANRFIETINAAFKAKLPMADANSYPGITFP